MDTSRPGRSAPRLAPPVLSLVIIATSAAACARVEAQEAATPSRVSLTRDDLPQSPSAARGAGVYQRWCVGCHGEDGRGDGPAARWLDPLPRDLQAGRFKFRSTPSGSLPTVDDLVRTISRGLKGSSMPAFPLLPEIERRDVAEYVLWLADVGRARIEAESLVNEDGLTMEQVRAEHLAGIRERLAARRAAAQPIGIPPEPPADDTTVARGKELYAAKCLSCHGETGVGDGPSSNALRDARDARILPRNFTRGRLRGGESPQDIFRRLRTGLDGTPMPSYSDSDADLWAMVRYVMTLRQETGAEEQIR